MNPVILESKIIDDTDRIQEITCSFNDIDNIGYP